MPELVSIHRLARSFKLPREWLQGEADAGRIPCLKVGGRYLFNPRAVGEALAEMAAKGSVQKVGDDHG